MLFVTISVLLSLKLSERKFYYSVFILFHTKTLVLEFLRLKPGSSL